MKKIGLVLLSILIMATMILGLSIAASAETTGKREIIEVPSLPLIDRPSLTTDEFNLDIYAIEALFPKEIEVRFEGSNIYAEDIGAEAVTLSCPGGYFVLEFIDGYWTAEIGTGPFDYIWIHFASSSKSVGVVWSVSYNQNGIRDPYISIRDYDSSVYASLAAAYDYMGFQYLNGDLCYEDKYRHGLLEEHIVQNFNDYESVCEVHYNSENNINYISLYTNGYYYYFPGQGWSSSWDTYIPCEAPVGYEDKDETYFTANNQSLICFHTEWIEANCSAPQTCRNCGLTKGDVGEHKWDEGVVTTEPTCTEIGIKTFTCQHNEEHTKTEEVEALGHTEEALTAKAATCTETGLTAGAKCSVCDEIITAQETVPALGHKYDNACDGECNTCAEVRTPAQHVDENKDHICDECSAELPNDGLSGGAIAGITIGAIVVAGAGGFSLFWFVIKKKTWGDLIGLFTK